MPSPGLNVRDRDASRNTVSVGGQVAIGISRPLTSFTSQKDPYAGPSPAQITSSTAAAASGIPLEAARARVTAYCNAPCSGSDAVSVGGLMMNDSAWHVPGAKLA